MRVPAEEVTVSSCITNKTKCEAGTPVSVEVAPNLIYKFYALNDDTTKNEVTLIMDRNLYSVEDLANNTHDVAWVNKSDYNDDTNYGSMGNNNKGPLTALKVLKQRTSGWTNIPVYTYVLEDDGNKYPPISKSATATTEESVVENVRVRLPKDSEIKAIIGADTPWLYENLKESGDNNTKGYWTSTSGYVSAGADFLAMYIAYSGSNYEYPVSLDGIGLRPVIALSK